jgi:molybdopterin converting factor small subunit
MRSSKPDTIRVTVRLFSVARHRDGKVVDRLELILPAGIRAADVLRRLRISRDLEPALSINDALVKGSARLADGDTLSIIPMVAGG